MAGVATTAEDKPNVEETLDALSFDIDRGHYRFQVGLFACFILALAILPMMMPSMDILAVSIFCIVLLAVGVASSAKRLRLSGPILRIDREGILDRRLMREPVPWSKIKRIYVREVTEDPKSQPPVFAVVIDIGHPRVADLIQTQGLAMEPPRDDAALARRIVDYANAMRARHARAGASWPGLSRPSTSL
jgi:hypothetical protein